MLVSGYSGIGKSSVVNELHKVLVPPRGLFAGGKFEQYKRDIPYATLAQAFQSLVRGLLAKSEADLAPWRDALSKALDSMDSSWSNSSLSWSSSWGSSLRFNHLNRSRRELASNSCFGGSSACSPGRTTLGALSRRLAMARCGDARPAGGSADPVRHAKSHADYRDNEVQAAHPLMRKVGDIKAAGGKVAEIALEPLAREDFGRLIADTFRCELDRAVPLAHLVHEKTGGNPFFANQFIHALAEEGLLTLDHAAARAGPGISAAFRQRDTPITSWT